MTIIRSLLLSRYGAAALAGLLVGWLAMAAAMTWGVGSPLVRLAALLLSGAGLLLAAGALTAGLMSIFGDAE